MSLKVVVVDDNENNLLLEKDLLEVAGFTVFTAVDATGGIILTRQELPDLLVLDIRLPDMRGSDAAMILRKDERTRDIPIVFVTASVMQEGMDETRSIPNSTFIGKPINTRTFVNEIKRFYETREARHE